MKTAICTKGKEPFADLSPDFLNRSRSIRRKQKGLFRCFRVREHGYLYSQMHPPIHNRAYIKGVTLMKSNRQERARRPCRFTAMNGFMGSAG